MKTILISILVMILVCVNINAAPTITGGQNGKVMAFTMDTPTTATLGYWVAEAPINTGCTGLSIYSCVPGPTDGQMCGNGAGMWVDLTSSKMKIISATPTPSTTLRNTVTIMFDGTGSCTVGPFTYSRSIKGGIIDSTPLVYNYNFNLNPTGVLACKTFADKDCNQILTWPEMKAALLEWASGSSTLFGRQLTWAETKAALMLWSSGA